MLYAQLHGRTKKASQTSAPSADDLGNPAAAMEGTCFLRLTPVAIPPPSPSHCSSTRGSQLSKHCQNQVAGNSKQVQ